MFLSALLCLTLAVPNPPGAEVLRDHEPVRFVENLGQADEAVRFLTRSGALDAFVTNKAMVLRIDNPDAELQSEASLPESVVLRLSFENALDEVSVTGEATTGGVVHSYCGTDTQRWVRAAPVFSTLLWKGVAEGVDVRLLERAGRLSYDLLLEPEADLSEVILTCEGSDRLELLAPDRLVIHTPLGPLEQVLPAAWEVDELGKQIPVHATFRLLDGRRFGFAVEGRNSKHSLVIDPGFDYGSFLGGSLLDESAACAIAPDGDLIVVGTTGSLNYPTTVGALQEARNGNNDAFVARVDASTGELVYATFFGGNDDTTFDPEGARDVAVSAEDFVIVVGRADSLDFPTTSGTVGELNPGGANGFVVRLDAHGELDWSTLVGGSMQDVVTAVALDAAGRPTLTGVTFSSDFPVTSGAFDESFNSIFFTNDIFVARLSEDGTSYDYATYVGGSLRDESLDIAVDFDDSAVLTGLTGSPDFPTTLGAYDESFNGEIPNDTDALVLRLSPSGDDLTWSTFLGSASVVEGRGLALDTQGNPVITGITRGDDFPTTPGVFQEVFAGGASDAFLSKISADGSSLHWSSYLGGEGDDQGEAVALTSGDLPTVTGTTTSIDFPTRGAAPVRTTGLPGNGMGSRSTAQAGLPSPGMGLGPATTDPGSYSPTHDNMLDGGQDAFLVRLGSHANLLRFGTLYGGSGTESGVDVDVDGFGAAFVTGVTGSADLPITGEAFDASYNGESDTFLARWSLPPFENLGLATGHPGDLPPELMPRGSLEPGRPFSLLLRGAPTRAMTWLLVGQLAGAVPFQGGVIVPWPAEAVIPLRTDASGGFVLEVAHWPADVPSGAQLVLQAWTIDTRMPRGAVSSNAVAIFAP